MAITYTTGTFLPTATATVYTLFTDATGGAKKFRINTTNLPAGTILNLSFQALNTSGGSYVERSNATLSNPVAVPAAPAIGYEPDWQSEDFVVEYGFQVQANVISGTLPTTALDWTEASVS